jgi:hypothetical protein
MKTFLKACAAVGALAFANITFAAKVGYYDLCNGQGYSGQASVIVAAGHTPVNITTLTYSELSAVDALFVTNCSNGDYGSEYLNARSDIFQRVSEGMALSFHDRYVVGAASVIPSASISAVREFINGTFIDVLDNTTLVTTGVAGIISNTDLDGGGFSNHGYITSSSLNNLPNIKKILSTSNPTEVVTFSYRYGAGVVLYSTIPLDHYLYFGSFGVFGQMQRYATNVVDYLTALSGGIPIANAGVDKTVDSGQAVTLTGSGQSPKGYALSYSWSQIGGPSVQLTNISSATLAFTAPVVTANTTLSFQLIVTDSRGVKSTPSIVNVSVIKQNNPPIADAGDASPVREGASKTLNAIASYDPDGDAIVSYAWNQVGGPIVALNPGANVMSTSFVAPIGASSVSFTVTVSDGKLSTVSPTITIPITANNPPVANAGAATTADENTAVTLNGSASTDPDGDAISFSWTQVSGPPVTLSGVATSTPSFTAPWVGIGGQQMTFQLTATDNYAANPRSGVAVAVVNVLNANDPPNCSLARPSVTSIWPPNHALVPVSILGITDPDASNFTLRVTGVTQDEPTNGLGDGDTAPDAMITIGAKADSVNLRAERAGNGNGRVYRISFTATDLEGSCNGTVKVTVPHSRSGTAVDDGQVHNSTQ